MFDAAHFSTGQKSPLWAGLLNGAWLADRITRLDHGGMDARITDGGLGFRRGGMWARRY